MQNKIQLTFCIQEQGAPHNVLTQHRKNNRANQPPDLGRLFAAALHQAGRRHQDNEVNPQQSDGEDEDQDQDQDQDKARAARHSMSTGEVKPDTLAYYRGTPWSVILTQAKIKYRRHIALHHGFPDRDEHLADARDIILEAIEDYKNENGILDQREFNLLYICTSTYHLIKISNRYARWSV
jgi:hypothetical protein